MGRKVLELSLDNIKATPLFSESRREDCAAFNRMGVILNQTKLRQCVGLPSIDVPLEEFIPNRRAMEALGFAKM